MPIRDLVGLLVDANIAGHRDYLRGLLEKLGLWPLLTAEEIVLLTFNEVGIVADVDDRTLWNRCQQQGLILLTDNRNRENDDSLQAVLGDTWTSGDLPTFTLANKERFQRDGAYAARVAQDLAELLYGAKGGQFRDQPRIYVPLD